MSFVLFVEDCLTGEVKVINHLFISEEEARLYCNENKLIFYQIVDESQYRATLQQRSQERYLRQQRVQPQYQQVPERILVREQKEPEESESFQQPKLPRKVGVFVHPVFVRNLNFCPEFIHTKKKVK